MTTDNTTGIDAMQLAALRKCDDVCLFHRDGKSYLRAIKRAKRTEADPFATDQIIEVPAGTKWTDYSRDGGMSWPMPAFDGFAMIGNYADSAWRTIATLLRASDQLTLYWQRDAWRSPVVESVGFHGDAVGLIVTRGKAILRFHVSASIGPDNSARMIKNVRPVEYRLTTAGA